MLSIQFVLATPIFGLSLALSPMAPLDLAADINPSTAAFVDPVAAANQSVSSAVSAEEAQREAYREALKERAELAVWHKRLGIATWGAMTATVLLGFVQYYNLYGIFADQGSNPCVQGTAIFGQSQCSGTPWPHALSAAATAGLYYATFALSLMMPDPDDASEGNSAYARTLRTHKLLRWVHFVGMAAQAVLGVVVANGESFGLDRANNYRTLQALSTVHMGVGLVTYGALTWAGFIML